MNKNILIGGFRNRFTFCFMDETVNEYLQLLFTHNTTIDCERALIEYCRSAFYLYFFFKVMFP